MTLTHNCNTPWVDNHLVDLNKTLPRNNGLTSFGRLVIKEMNRYLYIFKKLISFLIINRNIID
jgi:microsomal dipeptidase-like Zn-dependent dipeptidase